jgi:dTDP-4-dehydrorhamnose 3,5-epimerase
VAKFNGVGLGIPDVKLISRDKYTDERGWLDKIYSINVLSEFGWNSGIKQINHTFTNKVGTIRGMHYQHSPKAEMKMVTCLRGEIFDVVVDLRPQSENFLKWVSVALSANSGKSLLIPKGFAHGFQALSNNVELLYLHSAEYDQQKEGCLNPFDKRLKISWPLAVSEISLKDLNCKKIDSDFYGVSI